MVKLLPKTPCDGLLPIELADATVTEIHAQAITCVAPFTGQTKKVSAALKAAIGAAWPTPGRTTGKAGGRIVWSGLGQAMVLGPKVNLDGAAVSDQSDGWAYIALEGTGVRDILARLTPLDLRDSQFKRGHAARSLLGHMPCVFLRTGVDRYELLVYRSMAASAVQELRHAAEMVQGQKELAAQE